MKNQTGPFTQSKIPPLTIPQATTALVESIRTAPEFQSFIVAIEHVHQDKNFQRLNAQTQARQRVSQWGFQPSGDQLKELKQLEEEIKNLAVVQEYQQIELEMCTLLRAVDEIISQEIGLPFAENAQRSSCACCG